MRERTTWSRAEIAKTAFGRTAEDPRAMNQDHLKQQPAADAYTIGGPSEFGEDVHPSAGTWKAEQKGGETARNEIGMPEMRRDTFNHPEKTASVPDEEALLLKADLAAKVARTMLKKASEAAIEDQALALMHLPDAALVETANRLAAQDEEKEADQGQNDQGQKQAKDATDEEKEAHGQQDQGQKQAKDANDDEAQGQGQQDQGQAKQGGQVPPQFKENIEKMKDKAKDKDKDEKDEKGQGKEASAGDQFVQALKLGDGQGIQAALQQMMAGAFQQMMGQQQGQQQPMAQGQNQQQPMAQQVQQQMGQQQVQQQMAQGQNQQQPMAQQQQMAEDQLLDQMLQDELGQPGQMMMGGAEPEIQMEASSMDVGEVQLGEADAVLSTLFASNPEYQNAAEASQIQSGGQPVMAGQGMGRTASTRTVGTRPSNGVAQIGGASGSQAGGSDVDRLSNLWATAPDVKNVFR